MPEFLAPAKLNLGLEVMRKRDDGYHDLKTMFCAVSLFDSIRIRASDRDHFAVSDPSLQDGNLIQRVLDRWDADGPERPSLAVDLRKRIPAAAGLGGASSDAAVVLRAIAEMSGSQPDASRIATIATSVGSDVPFFLRGGRAVGEGRGDILRPLPYLRMAALIVSPALTIPDKTRTLFSALRQEDMSIGSDVQRLIDNPDLLFDRADASIPNSFERPLYAFYPELASVAAAIRSATGRYPSVSGAGPSLYLLARTLREALDMRRTVAKLQLDLPCALYCVRALGGPAPVANRGG